MNRIEIARELRQEANKLLSAATLLDGATTNNKPTPINTGKRSTMSAAARKRISDAQKKRWAKFKKAA